MSNYEREAQRLLRSLGVNGSYKGFQFAAYGIEKVIENPELVTEVCKGLYVEVASHFQVSLGSAERNIRTLRNVIWKYGDRELLQKIFGNVEEIPGNAVFIDVLAAYLLESWMDDKSKQS